MKNTEAFATIRRLLLILISFLLCLSFVGCQLAETPPAEDPKEEEEGLKGGFTSKGSIQYPHYFAYSSDEREFDIDNVTLTVYYGVYLSYQSLEEYRDDTASYSSFDFTIESFTVGCEPIYHLVRHIDENFVSEKYLCDVRYTSDLKAIRDIEFEHSEEVRLPRELFANDSGCIWLHLEGDNVLRGEGEESRNICSAAFWYKKSGNKVTLSKYEQS